MLPHCSGNFAALKDSQLWTVRDKHKSLGDGAKNFASGDWASCLARIQGLLRALHGAFGYEFERSAVACSLK